MGTISGWEEGKVQPEGKELHVSVNGWATEQVCTAERRKNQMQKPSGKQLA